MAEDGEIGSVSNWHYSFMGAQPIHEALSSAGEEVGRLLAADNVDVALLVPCLTDLYGCRWRSRKLHRAIRSRHSINQSDSRTE